MGRPRHEVYGKLDSTLASMLKHKRLSLWFQNLAQGSWKTAETYLRGLWTYQKDTGTRPKELVERAKADLEKLEDEVQTWVLEKLKTHAPKGVSGWFSGIKSWLDFNKVSFTRRVRLPKHVTPTIEDEPMLTQEDLRRILQHADIEDRAAVAMAAFTGARPETAVQLRLMDLPELVTEGGRASFKKSPTLVLFRPESTTKHRRYFNFLIGEGIEIVKAYLEHRMRGGEALSPSSPLISSRGRPVGYDALYQRLRRLLRRAGYNLRPYALRSYFDSAMMSTVPHTWQQFFMGHKGDIEAVYTTSKVLPPEKVEEARQVFSKAEPYLSTVQREGVNRLKEEAALEAMRSVARAFDIDPMRVRIEKQRELGREPSSEEEIQAIQNEIRKLRPGGEANDPKRIVRVLIRRGGSLP